MFCNVVSAGEQFNGNFNWVLKTVVKPSTSEQLGV